VYCWVNETSSTSSLHLPRNSKQYYSLNLLQTALQFLCHTYHATNCSRMKVPTLATPCTPMYRPMINFMKLVKCEYCESMKINLLIMYALKLFAVLSYLFSAENSTPVPRYRVSGCTYRFRFL